MGLLSPQRRQDHHSGWRAFPYGAECVHGCAPHWPAAHGERGRGPRWRGYPAGGPRSAVSLHLSLSCLPMFSCLSLSSVPLNLNLSPFLRVCLFVPHPNPLPPALQGSQFHPHHLPFPGGPEQRVGTSGFLHQRAGLHRRGSSGRGAAGLRGGTAGQQVPPGLPP